jgi:hypothetical protein
MDRSTCRRKRFPNRSRLAPGRRLRSYCPELVKDDERATSPLLIGQVRYSVHTLRDSSGHICPIYRQVRDDFKLATQPEIRFATTRGSGIASPPGETRIQHPVGETELAACD